MNTRTLLPAIAVVLLSACKKEPATPSPSPAIQSNKVLLLKVDFLSNTFEGGKELVFDTHPETFTIITEYQSPGDFGGIKLIYSELNKPLFEGSIIWMGCGEMTYPESLTPPGNFASVTTTDVVLPAAGFENVFNPGNQQYDYQQVWMAVQNRTKVRQYLSANPSATVKLFLYTPSVGEGNPADWDWILVMD